MDYAELIKWIITIGIGAIITVAGSLVGLYLLIRNIPNEIKKQKLAVEKEKALTEKEKIETSKEDVSLAKQIKEYAIDTAAEAIQLKDRLTKLESDYDTLLKEQIATKKTINTQNDKILEQAKTIKIQAEQIRVMNEKALLQDEKIASLTVELSLYKKTNGDCK